MAKTSIIILSYNTYQITRDCIESIRKYTTDTPYEIIVVDNNSQDESVAWLKEQTDIKLICNKENLGFPKGCNQGMALAEQENDILLLNSDTIVTPRWLKNLQIALYSESKVGAVSCMTNNCSNWQEVDVDYQNFQELIAFADKGNHSNPQAWELRPRLIGFCYLIKNAVWQQVGYLDEQFSPGNFEDDDYSLRINLAGYKLLLCKDTFIHHYGTSSFTKAQNEQELNEKKIKYNKLLQRNKKLLLEKWQITADYAEPHNVIFDVNEPAESTCRIFIIGCNIGMGICYLQAKYPRAQIIGAADNWCEAALASRNMAVSYCPNLETDIFRLLIGKYDYILIANKKETFKDFDGYVEKLMPYLALDGSIHI